MLFFYLFPQYIWYEFLDLYINISNYGLLSVFVMSIIDGKNEKPIL